MANCAIARFLVRSFVGSKEAVSTGMGETSGRRLKRWQRGTPKAKQSQSWVTGSVERRAEEDSGLAEREKKAEKSCTRIKRVRRAEHCW